MLVVHFMCSAYGSEVPIIRVAEPLRALMDENIVYQEISQSIKRNSRSDPYTHIGNTVTHAEKEQRDRRRCEDQEESIVAFENASVVLFMVILVQRPKATVHHEFMREPRDELHQQECQDHRSDIDQPGHCVAKIAFNVRSR